MIATAAIAPAADAAPSRRHFIFVLPRHLEQTRAVADHVNGQDMLADARHNPATSKRNGNVTESVSEPNGIAKRKRKNGKKLARSRAAPRQADQTVNAGEQRDNADARLLDEIAQHVHSQCQYQQGQSRPPCLGRLRQPFFALPPEQSQRYEGNRVAWPSSAAGLG